MLCCGAIQWCCSAFQKVLLEEMLGCTTGSPQDRQGLLGNVCLGLCRARPGGHVNHIVGTHSSWLPRGAGAWRTPPLGMKQDQGRSGFEPYTAPTCSPCWSREWQYSLPDWLWSQPLPLGMQGISNGGFYSADCQPEESVRLQAVMVGSG